MRSIQLILLMCVAVGAAQAQITTKLVSVPNELGPDTATYDLVIDVPFGDDWGWSSMNASLTGATFYQHPAGSNTQPDPVLFATFPSLKWDTFVTCPQGWPNTSGLGATPGIGMTPVFGAASISAVWFKVYPNGGAGSWVVARLTVQDIVGAWSLRVSGMQFSSKYSTTPYWLIVPEPGTAVPFFAMAQLLMVRARRGRVEWSER